MKNRMIRLLIVTMVMGAFAGCGQNETAVTSTKDTETSTEEAAFLNESVEETTLQSGEESELEKETQADSELITGMFQELRLKDKVTDFLSVKAGNYVPLSYSYDETVSVYGNAEEDFLIIHDGDKELKVDIPWQSPHMVCPSIEAYDYDKDGEKEYYISTLWGTGTGCSIDALYYVDVVDGTPKVSEYTYEKVIGEFEDRIVSDKIIDSDFHTISISFLDTKGEKTGDTSLFLEDLLTEMEATKVEDIAIGDFLYFDYVGGKPYASITGGVVFDTSPMPIYDESFKVSAPVILHEDGSFSLGDFTVKSNSLRTQTIEEYRESNKDMVELNTEYYDLNHDGYKDMVVTSVYLPEKDMDPVDSLQGAGYGKVSVYPYVSDNRYYGIPLFETDFAVCHAGNAQLFVTHVDGYDYLIRTSFWAGQGSYTYCYEVMTAENDMVEHFSKEIHEENLDNSEPPKVPEVFEGIEKWLNEDSVLLVATDIDMEEGNDLFLTTKEQRIHPSEYLNAKKKWYGLE